MSYIDDNHDDEMYENYLNKKSSNNFIQKVENKETAEFSDYERIKNYQNNIMIMILFDPPRYPAGQKNLRLMAKLHREAKDCIDWLRENYGQ